tara:strand:- start:591 stop:716 length:126 start_codon:yes stop_codon:yes gene_type:complete
MPPEGYMRDDNIEDRVVYCLLLKKAQDGLEAFIVETFSYSI